MAIVKCPECGKEYSDTAKRCVNCGYRKALKRKDFIIVVIALLLQLTTLILLLTCNVYNYDRIIRETYYSEFGSQYDYTSSQIQGTSETNVFYMQSADRDYKFETSILLSLTPYVIVIFALLGIGTHFYSLLKSYILPNMWLFTTFCIAFILFQSIALSASHLSMIGANGYYEAHPSFIWFIAIALEIIAVVLGRSINGNKKQKKVSIQSNTSVKQGFVDSHGIYHETD